MENVRMASITKAITSNTGGKRTLSGVLASLSEVLAPISGGYIPIVSGLFGATGIFHAIQKGTANKHVLSTISAVLATLLTLSNYIPSLAPLAPKLQQLLQLFAPASVATYVASKK